MLARPTWFGVALGATPLWMLSSLFYLNSFICKYPRGRKSKHYLINIYKVNMHTLIITFMFDFLKVKLL